MIVKTHALKKILSCFPTFQNYKGRKDYTYLIKGNKAEIEAAEMISTVDFRRAGETFEKYTLKIIEIHRKHKIKSVAYTTLIEYCIRYGIKINLSDFDLYKIHKLEGRKAYELGYFETRPSYGKLRKIEKAVGRNVILRKEGEGNFIVYAI